MRVHAIPIRLAPPPRHHHTPRRTACGGGGAGGPKQLRSRRRPSPVRAFDTAERALAAHPPSLRADDASRARSAGALLFSSTRPPPLPVPEKIRGDHPILHSCCPKILSLVGSIPSRLPFRLPIRPGHTRSWLVAHLLPRKATVAWSQAKQTVPTFPRATSSSTPRQAATQLMWTFRIRPPDRAGAPCANPSQQSAPRRSRNHYPPFPL
jgi:hypothetical protein